MKRFGRLMDAIATWDNVSIAYRKASAASRNSYEVASFRKNYEENVNTVVRDLLTGTWQPQPFSRFLVHDPKQRVIHASPFYDRVVHHALMNVAGRCLERGAVPFSFACRKGRGHHAAVQHAVKCIRRNRYFRKLDVRKYFDSVRHVILEKLFHSRIKDEPLLTLFMRLVCGFQTLPQTGLPIGTLTSQYFANFYLDGLDRQVLETLHCRSYVRYMDDFVVFDDDPGFLRQCLMEIETWLQSQRGLVLKGCRKIVESRAGLPFLGYRITPRGVLLSRNSRRRFAVRLAIYEREWVNGLMTTSELQCRVDALLAFTDFANCHEWRRKLLNSRSEMTATKEGIRA